MKLMTSKQKKNFWKRKRRTQMFCHYCKRSVSRNVHEAAENRATIDHIIPISKGGTSRKENTVVCCRKCNREKGAKEAAEIRV